MRNEIKVRKCWSNELGVSRNVINPRDLVMEIYMGSHQRIHSVQARERENLLYLDLKLVYRIRSVTATKGYCSPATTELASTQAIQIRTRRRPQQEGTRSSSVYNSWVCIQGWRHPEWQNIWTSRSPVATVLISGLPMLASAKQDQTGSRDLHVNSARCNEDEKPRSNFLCPLKWTW